MKRADGNCKLGLLFILGLIFSATNLGAQDGLVGHWSFDELDGQRFSDHSSFNIPGINQGGVLVEGKKGKALYFNGDSDYGIISNEFSLPPDHLKALGSGSISFWFRVDHIPLVHGIAPLFYYGNQTACDFFDAANEGLIIEVGHSPVHWQSEWLYFTMWKNGCTYPSFCFDSRTAISVGEWHHIVVVVGEDYNTGFLDGVEMTNRSYNFGNASYSQFFEDAITHEVLWLGRGHWDRTEQYLEGAMDELMIFDRPLGAEEVAAIYRDTTGAISGLTKSGLHSPALELFPNPAANTLSIKTIAGSNIGIYSMEGVLLLEYPARGEKTDIDISSLSPGLYVARSGESKQKFLVD